MKKLLSFLAIVGLTTTASASVIACSCGAQTDAGPKKVNVDFQIKLTNGTKIYKGMNGTIEIEDYQKQKDLLKDYDLKLVFLPTQADGHPIVKEVGDFDREKGIITIEGLEAGTIKVQVEATLKSKKASQADQKDTKKISNALEIKVEIASLDAKDSADLFKIPSVKNLVNDNTNVTEDEANDARDKVAIEVKKVLEVIKGIQIDVDYTINFDPIKKGGNFSKGVKLGVQAKVGSKLLKEKSQTQVEVIFLTDTRKNLSEIKFPPVITNKVVDHTNVTEDEANDAQQKVKYTVQNTLKSIKGIEGIQPDDDYTLVNLDHIKPGNLASGVTISVEAKESSKLLKQDKGTKIEINVTFQSKPAEDLPKNLSEIKLYEITNEIVADNTNVTKDEAQDAQKFVKDFVQFSLQLEVDFNISAENDYTLVNLDDIKAGNLANGIAIQVQAKVGSKLLIGGTTTELKVTFQSDTRKDLSEIKLPVITNEVDDNANVTTTEADDARAKVATEVQIKLNDSIKGINPEDDYTLVNLDDIKEGNLANGITIQVQAKVGSNLVKTNSSTAVEVIFKTKPDTRKDLSEVEFKYEFKNQVDDNTMVTSDEADSIQKSVANFIQTTLKFKVNWNISAENDYTILNLDDIHTGNLASGVTIQVQAKEKSKILKTGTMNQVLVTFQSDTRKSLKDFQFDDQIIQVDDNTNVTKDEAYAAKQKIKGLVQNVLKVIKGIQIGRDYLLDGLDKIQDGKLSDELTITIQAMKGSKLVKTNSWTTIKVTFQSDTRKSLGDITLDAINNEVDDNANVTETEADAARDKVATEVWKKLDASIKGIQPEDDYTIDLDKIQAGNLANGVTITIQAAKDSTLVKTNSSTAVQVTFQSKPVEDLRLDLEHVNFEALTFNVEDNTKLTLDEANKAKEVIKTQVRQTLESREPTINPEDDYIIDKLDSRIKEGASLKQKVAFWIVAREKSEILKTGSKAWISITFLTEKKDNTKTIDGLTIKLEIYVKNPKKVTKTDIQGEPNHPETGIKYKIYVGVNKALVNYLGQNVQAGVDYNVLIGLLINVKDGETLDLSKPEGKQFLVQGKSEPNKIIRDKSTAKLIVKFYKL